MSEVVLHPTFVAKWPWAEFPLIEAPSPDDRREIVRLKISPNFIVGNLRKNNRTPIYQCWTHLVGKIPPVPNVDLLPKTGLAPSLTTLCDSHALFKGVERPHGTDANGDDVYIYLLKISVTIRYEHSPPVSVPVVQRLDDDLLLAVYVRRTESLQIGEDGVWGSALRIELVEADQADRLLPFDHGSRYNERVW